MFSCLWLFLLILCRFKTAKLRTLFHRDCCATDLTLDAVATFVPHLHTAETGQRFHAVTTFFNSISSIEWEASHSDRTTFPVNNFSMPPVTAAVNACRWPETTAYSISGDTYPRMSSFIHRRRESKSGGLYAHAQKFYFYCLSDRMRRIININIYLVNPFIRIWSAISEGVSSPGVR